MSKFHISHTSHNRFFIDNAIPLFPDDIDPGMSFEAQTGASDNILPTLEFSDSSTDLVPESSHSSPPLIRRSNRHKLIFFLAQNRPRPTNFPTFKDKERDK
ncbi:hypothetical protein LWI28_010819 [Acer negundo]|uniref:Uncharacterized protein n=1 Tax=Acer negundo TaxID=4023 RepID=A0AAD5NGA7_ACENE|nr:hypothetical protein LWI28_010819 [Acer negundo]